MVDVAATVTAAAAADDHAAAVAAFAQDLAPSLPHTLLNLHSAAVVAPAPAAPAKVPPDESFRIPLKDFDDEISGPRHPHPHPHSRDASPPPTAGRRKSLNPVPGLLFTQELEPEPLAHGPSSSSSHFQHPKPRKLKRRTSLAGAPGMLRTDGPWWTDPTGRTLMLRGVNVSGSAKLPFKPYMPTHVRDGFFNDTDVSFIGRPFPLEEADEHFGRLRRWGLNFLRYNVAWEALEHGGPGVYDYDYMDYVVQILLKAKQYGFRVFIDPHQDVWSRFSGGSGAPGWTFRVAGLDFTKFKETYAAIVHNTYDDPANFPKMIWPTNYTKLAAATMFTLFFGGATFAPNHMVPEADGTMVNIQEFLQGHYCRALAELAKRIQLTPGLEDEVVIGYDTLNEPSQGWIGVEDLSKFPEFQDLKNGHSPTPFQAMLLGMGFPSEVEIWSMTWRGPAKTGMSISDPKGVSAWLPVSTEKKWGCVWAQHGVWDPQSRSLLRKDYFHKHPVTGAKIDFLKDFWRLFVHRVTKAVRAVHHTAVMFIEPPVNEAPPPWDAANGDPTYRIAYAPHWYDGLTLMNKHFNRWYNVDVIGFKRGKYPLLPLALRFGERGVREIFKSQIETLRRDGFSYLGQHPCIMGEIGIPYDMDDRKAYRDGDYSTQERAMDTNIRALEANLINFTLWNYVSDNNHAWGDGWNGEDLSIFSRVAASEPIPSKPNATTPSTEVTPLVDEAAPMPEELHSGSTYSATFVTPSDYNESRLTPPRQTPQAESIASSNGIDPSKPFEDDSGHLDVGGRALHAFARPYPVLTPGTPVFLTFDMASSLFTFSFTHPKPDSSGEPSSPTLSRMASQELSPTSPTSSAHPAFKFAKFLPRPRRFSTLLDHVALPDDSHGELSATPFMASVAALPVEVEIYVPRIHYPRIEDVEVWVSEGHVRWDIADQRLHWRCGCYDETPASPKSTDHRTSFLTNSRHHHTGPETVEHTIVFRRKKVGQLPLLDVGLRRKQEIKAQREEEIEKLETGGKVCGSCSVM
ncbi:glycoside hydrolase superfamily [Zopfochytrium polystomum]|nr:glycoside hydrolase superfamily [Zopfochytrium polystomum]